MRGGRFLPALLGVVAVLALVEAGLRVVPGAPSLRALHEPRPDRPWLYGLRPGVSVTLASPAPATYTVNAAGFRDRHRRRRKRRDAFRIVVLGDGIAFGWGVARHETFPAVLEARLHASAPARRIEVLDLGVHGYNPYTEAALFADVGAAWAPDLVLVQFAVDDLLDPRPAFATATRLVAGALPAAAFPDPRRAAPRPSLALRACARLRLCALLVGGAASAGAADGDAPPTPAGTPEELAWLRARYADVARRAARAGAPFAVVLFPTAGMVTGAEPADLLARVRAVLAGERWPVIDLLPAFRAAHATGPLFLDGRHPTEAGHRVAAEAVADALACAHLLPGGVGRDCAVPAAAQQGSANTQNSPIGRKNGRSAARSRATDASASREASGL